MGQHYYIRLRRQDGSTCRGTFRADDEQEAIALAQGEFGSATDVDEIATGDAILTAKQADLLRETHAKVDELCRKVTLGHDFPAQTLRDIEIELENLRDAALRDYAM